jgi:hypothetical protein
MSQAASPSAVLASERPLGAIKLPAGDPSLGRRILSILAAGRSFVLVTTALARAPISLTAPPADLGERRFVVIRLDGTAELDFAAVLAACCRALDLAPGADRGAAHRAVVARLLRQARDTVSTILLIENADAVRDAVIEEMSRLFSLDDRCLLPTILVATPDFLARLKTPALGFLRDAIAAHVSLADGPEDVASIRDAPVPSRAATDRSGDAVAALEALARRIAERPSGTPHAAMSRPADHDRGGAAPLAALAQQASQLLKDLEIKAPPPSAADDVPYEAPRPVRRPPILLRRRAAPAGEVSAAPPAVTPPPAAPRFDIMPAALVAPRRRLGRSVAVATYLLVSVAVGAALVQAWRIDVLSVPAEWIEDGSVWLQRARTAIVGSPPALRDEATLALAALSPQAGPTAGISQDPIPSEPAEPVQSELAEPASSELAEPAPSEIAGAAPPDSVTIEATLVAATEAPPVTVTEAAPVAATEAPLVAMTDATPVAVTEATTATMPIPPLLVAALPPVDAAPAPVAAPSVPVNAPPVAAEPPAAPDLAAAPPAPTPAPIEQLLARGDQLLLTGDIGAARLFYEPAALAGDPRAALALGKTYDPLFLARIGARGIVADRAKATSWYRQAEAAGNAEARQRLGALIDRSPRRDARAR